MLETNFQTFFLAFYLSLWELEFGLIFVVLQLTLPSLLVQWTSWEWSVDWRVISIEPILTLKKQDMEIEWKKN